MLAMGFVFMLVHLLAVTLLQQRVLVTALVEQRLAGGGALPEPGALVVVRAIEDIRHSIVVDGEAKDYDVIFEGTTYRYSVAFSEATSTWSFEVTPPTDMPSELRFDVSVHWPAS